jgi:hypothetical protein
VAVSEVKRPLRNRFGIETVTVQIYNGYMYVTAIPQRKKFPVNSPFGCNGYVTAVAAGQSQRFCSGVGIFNWYYLSSPPQILRGPVVPLESGWLVLSVRLIQVSPLGYFTHISITTPIVSASKNYCR